jgi:hypothetical protein
MNTWFDQCFDKLVAHEGGRSFAKKFDCGLCCRFSLVLYFCMKRFVVNTHQRCIVFQNHFNSTLHYKNVVGSCSGLLHGCCPPAITWFIVSMWVYSVNGMSFRGRSHIRNESSCVVEPSVAHANTPTAILRIFWVILVVTAAFCMVIRLEFSRLFSACAVAVGQRPCRNKFTSQASTARNQASANGIQNNGFLSSTFTNKQPLRVFFNPFYFVNGSTSPVFFASNV